MPAPIEDPETFARAVAVATGRWSGTGEGGYPTIAPFRYREELELVLRRGETTLRYEQRTWRLIDESETPSRWELGLASIAPYGGLAWSSAQNGRTEALRGRALRTDAGVTLQAQAVSFGLDERMAGSLRVLHLGADSIDYELSMATQRVSDMELHLRATLARQP